MRDEGHVLAVSFVVFRVAQESPVVGRRPFPSRAINEVGDHAGDPDVLV